MKHSPIALSLSALLLGAPMATHAADHGHAHGAPTSYPALTGHLDFVQHLERVVDASDADAEIDEAYAHGHLGMTLHFSSRLTLNGALKIEGHPAGAAHDHHGHGGSGSSGTSDTLAAHDHDDDHDHTADDHDDDHDDDDHDTDDHGDDDDHDDHDADDHGNDDHDDDRSRRSSHDHDDHDDHDDLVATGDRWWEEHEARVQQLNLRYQGDDFHLLAGKFNPVVGLDVHAAPGLWGYQVFESYQISGRVGLGGGFDIDAGDHGRHRVEASLFKADTGFLSNTWITRAEPLREAHGGVANTDGLRSWALAVSGDGFYSYDLDRAWVEGLSYRFALAKQAKGLDGDKDEQRWSLGLQQRLTLGEWNGRLLFEHMAIDHLGGEAAHDRDHTTLGLAMERDRWRIGGSFTHIDNRAHEADENHDGHIAQLSAGYRLRPGVYLELGLMDEERDAEQRTRIGLAVKVDTHF